MLLVDAALLRALVTTETGSRARRQNEIIDGMGAGLTAALDAYAIDTPLRIAHFLAQIATESDGFCTTEEYASGSAYENRRDLGNVERGDGERFKGRGLIQLTGRANYARVGSLLTLDLVADPTRVNDAIIYLLVACLYWQDKRINQAADANDLLTVTRLVNGGMTGLADRRRYLACAKALVAGALAIAATPPGNGLPVLHRGSEGDAVSDLQSRLAKSGYKLGLDGDFGPATEIAVEHFQSAHGLAPDGIVGAVTWQALGAA